MQTITLYDTVVSFQLARDRQIQPNSEVTWCATSLRLLALCRAGVAAVSIISAATTSQNSVAKSVTAARVAVAHSSGGVQSERSSAKQTQASSVLRSVEAQLTQPAVTVVLFMCLTWLHGDAPTAVPESKYKPRHSSMPSCISQLQHLVLEESSF